MDQTPLFKELEKLFQAELYSNVCVLGEVFMSIIDNLEDSLPLESRIKTIIYIAESFYEMKNYRKARKMYEMLDDYNFSSTKMKQFVIQGDVCSSDNKLNMKNGEYIDTDDLLTSIESKYKQHLCFIAEKNYGEALHLLDSIPETDRNAKVYMAFGKLYHRSGKNTAAIANFKEVLKDYPLALEAAHKLLILGVDSAEVNKLVCKKMIVGIGCIRKWVDAMGYVRSYKYKEAISALNDLLAPNSVLRDNVNLFLTLGEVYYFAGDFVNAGLYIRESLLRDRYCSDGYGMLAMVYLNTKDNVELKKLIPIAWNKFTDDDIEMLMAICCYLYAINKLDTALDHAVRICELDTLYMEAFIIRGCILFDLGKVYEAIFNFREAYRLAPNRYEPHKGLVDCYLHMQRHKEALTICINCCVMDHHSPRSLTLHAFVLKKDPKNLAKSKVVLERVINEHSYLPAVYILADVYAELNDINAGIELLKDRAEEHPCARLHQKLGELYQKQGDSTNAVIHYEIALRFDPTNHEAQEGLKSQRRFHLRFKVVRNSYGERDDDTDATSDSMDE